MNRLWVRLTFGFLLVTLVLLAAISFAIFAAVESSFTQYVGARNAAMLGSQALVQMEEYYAKHGTWAGVEPLLPTPGRGQGARMGRGPQWFVADAQGSIVASTNPEWVGRRSSEIGSGATTPLIVGGRTVGVVGQVTPGDQALDRAETQFRNQVSQALAQAGLAAALLAVAMGVLLAYTLTRPLQRLAAEIGSLTSARLGTLVQVGGPTEIRGLAAAFNALSERLAQSERQRQQMASDVAHELRTPVTVLRGHLEGMMDGVYPIDEEHLAVAYDQTIHLAHLVDDLRLLTQAEAGRLPLNLVRVDPTALVEASATRFLPLAEDADVTLVQQAGTTGAHLLADPVRMQQVFDNLLANALRHTPGGGEVRLETCLRGPRVEFVVANTGSLPSDQAQRVFDRFWRGDDARTHDMTGSGLGLAITRQLVLLHQGSIRVESKDGMTAFVVDVPAA